MDLTEKIYKRKDILELFYDFKTFNYDKQTKKWQTKFDTNDYKRHIKLRIDLVNSKDNKIILKKG